jgi:BASS family bile acid:Na+ symporter
VKKLQVVEANLLPLVVATTLLGLIVPAFGHVLEPGIGLLLALLMFFVSITVNLSDLHLILRRPWYQIIALVLVYGPMSVAGLWIGRLVFGPGHLAVGQALVGALPTDVSAPLLVLLGRGNVALAAVMNAINTALSPFLVPALLLLLTGVRFQVRVEPLILELFLVVVAPMAVAIWLRTRFPEPVGRFDPAYSFSSSLIYLLLLLAVVGSNAQQLISYGWYAVVILLAQLALNLTGYALGAMAGWIVQGREDRIAFLFTISKKEFSLAAALVFASELPREVAIPAVFYAVLQMITSPIAVNLLNRFHARSQKNGS